MLNLTKEMRIGVIGLGRIGLPSALLFAEVFSEVIGIDKDRERIACVSALNMPFQENGLEEKLASSDLRFSPTLCPADLYVIAVSTLELGSNADLRNEGRFGLTLLVELLGDISDLNPGTPVIIESTLPLGGLATLAEHYAGPLIYCPERVAPGNVFSELASVRRCIASTSEAGLQFGLSFYDSLSIGVLASTPKVAEMVKLSENAFRDANIAFANRLAEICSEHDIDNREVVRIANTHPRVHILNSGLGAGGACLAPSTRSLDRQGLFDEVRKTNQRQIHRALELLVKEDIKSVALWGLSYKGNCDDLRCSPSMDLKALLEVRAIEVKTWDPFAEIGDCLTSLENAQTIVFGCKHTAFNEPALAQYVREHSSVKIILDVVNATDRSAWEKQEFTYLTV